jgi:hypothetical protein
MPFLPIGMRGIMISRVWVASNTSTTATSDDQIQAWAQSLNPDVAPVLERGKTVSS